jgi:RND superfamily putative drug exporter
METISEIWPESSSNDAFVVFDLDGADPLSEKNIRAFHAWMAESTLDEMVVDGFGIGRPAAGLDADQTVDFWLGDADEQTLAMREYLKEKFVSGDVTFHLFALSGSEVDPESRIHVQGMRQDAPGLLNSLEAGPDSEIFIGGFAAYSADNLQAISDALPMALTFIFGATMVLIFIQVRSIVIPIKAVVMNILSISASFGMMVVIFQWGYGAELLNFTPQPIDSVNPIILFCIVFGLSMDYEVLMLSRIHEEWERTGDNTLAVANGLQKTGRLITGAAAIMVVVFSAFGLSSVIILKQIGFGLALAILLDATVVRALVVPAAMRLMGKWNWWTPAWMSSSKNIEQIEKPEE